MGGQFGDTMQQRVEFPPATGIVLSKDGASLPGKPTCGIGLSRLRQRFEA
jgi:hypothetical protein